MSGSLLQAEGLAKTYRIGAGMLGELLGSRHRTLRAVDAVDLAIAPGETLALVGESGSGKTTTGRLLTLLESSSGGRIWFDGHEVTRLQGRALREYRRQVQMIFQNPYEALDPRLTVAQSVAEPLRLHGVATHGERRERVARMLEEVDLRPAASFMDRYPGDLSGGQLQRVAIARALVLSPRLIVADEPVSMLDVSVRAGIMMLLLRLQQSHGLSCLFITHDLAVARMMSQRIAVMYHGAIVEEGPTEALIARPAHPYTRVLINAVPEYGRPARRERAKAAGDDFAPAVGEIVGCAFQPRCPIARPDCASIVPPRILLGEGRAARCRYAEESAEVVSEP